MKIMLGSQCPPVIAKVSNDLYRPDKGWWSRMSYRLWLRVKGHFLDHVIGMEEPARDEIRNCLGVSTDTISIIPDPALSTATIAGLRALPSRTATESGEGRRFVAVGRLAPQKNIALMLRAFAGGAGAGDRLTIIGDGSERPKLERLTAQLGLNDRVTFAGYHPEPTAIMPDYDILLLSSNYEGVPAVILEALAARLTIIATDCSRSMAALLQQGRLGDLVRVGDEAMLANAIARARPGRQDAALSLAQAERFTVEHASELYLETMVRVRASKSLSQFVANTDCGACQSVPS
jgi:glycosyltransferase involved in cell wall biosynthesis